MAVPALTASRFLSIRPLSLTRFSVFTHFLVLPSLFVLSSLPPSPQTFPGPCYVPGTCWAGILVASGCPDRVHPLLERPSDQ